MNHASKRLINGTQLRPVFHKIKPSVSRMIINKDNIIFMATFRSKRSRAPDIRVNKIKGSSCVRYTRRIGKLNLFAKLTTLTIKVRLDRCMT